MSNLSSKQGLRKPRLKGRHHPQGCHYASQLAMNSQNMMDADRQDVLSFLSGSSDYAPASGQITGILKTMLDAMNADLSDAQSTESKAVSDYEALMAAKTPSVHD